jgi:hypothetical protein
MSCKPSLSTKDRFELRLMREAGVSIMDCCAYFNCSPATVYRVLSALRLRMGPEKLKRRQSARSQVRPINSQAVDRQSSSQ